MAHWKDEFVKKHAESAKEPQPKSSDFVSQELVEAHAHKPGEKIEHPPTVETKPAMDVRSRSITRVTREQFERAHVPDSKVVEELERRHQSKSGRQEPQGKSK